MERKGRTLNWADLKPREQDELCWWTGRPHEEWAREDQDLLPWLLLIADWIPQARLVLDELGLDDLGALWFLARERALLQEGKLFDIDNNVFNSRLGRLLELPPRPARPKAWWKRYGYARMLMGRTERATIRKAAEELSEEMDRGDAMEVALEKVSSAQEANWHVVARACEHVHFYYSSENLLDRPKWKIRKAPIESLLPFFSVPPPLKVDRFGFIQRYHPSFLGWHPVPVEKSPRLLRRLGRSRGRPNKVLPSDTAALASRLILTGTHLAQYGITTRELKPGKTAFPRTFLKELASRLGLTVTTVRRHLVREEWWPRDGFPERESK